MNRNSRISRTAEKSTLMRRVRQKDTAPELTVRKYLHRHGLRFVLHPADLPGRPDILLPRRNTAVFVHGCFWHGHDCRHGSVRAKTNASFWRSKLANNRERDRRKEAALRKLGWNVEVIWECEIGVIKKLAKLARRIAER